MSVMQRIVYAILKAIIQFFRHLFYPRQFITGRASLQLTRPTVVVSNHPNTLIDALVAAGVVSDPLFMLANAGLFKSPIAARMFSFLFCIPVERPQDVQGRPLNNEASFARCYAHLQAGNHLFIAPEGGSEKDRRLRPLRTGTARIALGAEAACGFEAGVQILPIGLTYQEPDKGGSTLAIQAGTPLRAKDWEALYLQDASLAYRDLTNAIETQLRQLLTDAPDKEMDAVLAVLEGISQAGSLPAPEAVFQTSRQLLARLQEMRTADCTYYHRLTEGALSYSSQLNKYQLTPPGMTLPKGSPVRWVIRAIPWFVPWGAGWLLFVVPLSVVRYLLNKISVDPGYNATVKWVGALFVLPVWVGLLGWMLAHVMSAWACIAAMVVVIGLGYVYAVWRPAQRILAAQWHGYWFSRRHPAQWSALQAEERRVWQLYQEWNQWESKK